MEQLGIDGQLLVTQIINFAIMVAILSKFLYKPVLRSIRARQQKIEEGLAMAATMEKEKEKLGQLHAQTLKKAEEEAQKIIAAAKKDAGGLKEEIIAKGHAEVVEMKHRLEQEIASRRSELEQGMTEQIVEIAHHMVRQLLGTILSQKQHREIIHRQLMHLSKQYEKSPRS